MLSNKTFLKLYLIKPLCFLSSATYTQIMPKRVGTGTNSASSSNKKSKKQPFLNLYKTAEAALEGLRKKVKGKRVLIPSEDLYKNVADELVGLLFLYTVEEVNDADYATLRFENTCIKDGDTNWRNYHDSTGQEDLDNYELSGFTDAHELYNKYLGLVNKARNDMEEAEKKEEEEKTQELAENLTGIEDKLKEGMSTYDILVLEFESVGIVKPHTILAGDHAGKSKFVFICPRRYDKILLLKHQHTPLVYSISSQSQTGVEAQVFRTNVHVAQGAWEGFLRQGQVVQGC